jgi:hypothetical protein
MSISGELLIPKHRERKVYKVMSRCPKCHSLSDLGLARTRRDIGRIERTRICDNPECMFIFDTIEERPSSCPHCLAVWSYRRKDRNVEVDGGERVNGGIYRVIKCLECKKYTETKEIFPVLEDPNKRPAGIGRFLK